MTHESTFAESGGILDYIKEKQRMAALNIKATTADTHVITLYLSGPIEDAKRWLRAECLREGLCVTIEPTLFIYTGGEEAGYRVGLLNYPRFPTSPEALQSLAEAIALGLLDATSQHSALMVTPTTSHWFTKRESV